MLNFLFTHTPLLYLTQSVWRDEAFSILMAQHPLPFMFDKLIFETPLYYILLHVWMRFFGSGEIAVRSLSLVGFTIATILVIEWASSTFKSKVLALFLPFFFFFNPMLLYYAFEIRTYGWVICFSVLAMLAYVEKRWGWYTIGAILAFYTHTYTIFLPAATLVHYAIHHKELFTKKGMKNIVHDPMVRASSIYAIAIAPWLIRIAMNVQTLAESWYYPIEGKLLKSVVGNLFIGYEGTPWHLWDETALLSALIIVASLAALIPKPTRVRNSYFLAVFGIPLGIVVGVSLFKPMFVNRYLIYVAVAQVLLIVCAIETVKNRMTQNVIALILALCVFGFNLWYPPLRPKKDTRAVITQINELMRPGDVVYAEHSLVYFETLYYSKQKDAVFLYNPKQKPFPWYVGDALVTPAIMATDFPTYPHKAYVVRRDGTFYVAYSNILARSEK